MKTHVKNGEKDEECVYNECSNVRKCCKSERHAEMFVVFAAKFYRFLVLLTMATENFPLNQQQQRQRRRRVIVNKL
jgi:hypothetical protein